MKTYEYHEAKQAKEDFEQGMKALFQVPKDAAKGKKSPQEAGLKRSKSDHQSRLPRFWRPILSLYLCLKSGSSRILTSLCLACRVPTLLYPLAGWSRHLCLR